MPIRTEPVLPEEDWQLRLEPPTDAAQTQLRGPPPRWQVAGSGNSTSVQTD